MRDVSFVITVFNKAVFLPGVVNAILKQQDLDECEYIFVDDGSTDNSIEVLGELLDGHENVTIISQENMGPAMATNRGIFAATKPYLKLVDGDDVLHPRATASLLNAMIKHDAGLAYCDIDVVTIDSVEMTAPDKPLSGKSSYRIGAPLEMLSRGCSFNLTCVLGLTNLMQETGGCDTRVLLQDYSLEIAMAYRTKFAHVQDVLAWAPSLEAAPQNRSSQLGDGAQVLHDLNFALALFIADRPDLDTNIKTRMLQQAAGRAWKWAKRKENCSFASQHFWRYVWALVSPRSGSAADRLLLCCEPFRIRDIVRMPD